MSSEWEAAGDMLTRQERKGIKPKTLGGDKGYDTRDFVNMLKSRDITPHVSQNSKRKGGSAIDGRTTRHIGYATCLPCNTAGKPAYKKEG